MNRKVIFVISLVAAVGLAAWALARSGKLAANDVDKIKVTASFYPMAEFARQVGGDKVAVTTLVKPGVEPHDYEPAPQDLVGLYQSKLFVYNGAGLEKWVDRIQPDLKSNNVTQVKASEGFTLKDGTGEDAGAPDPHVWMDPVLASREVDAIEAGLVKVDPMNAPYYRANAKAYKAKLSNLDKSFKTDLAKCTQNQIVTSHDAFEYLGERYGLRVLSISGLSPDEEPTPQKLAEVAQIARANNVHYIFFEELVSPKLSETIANEVGAKTIVFSPLEGLTTEEIDKGENYVTVQQGNLNNLRTALDCK
jgi:zinc transport system substrate-binding protein